MAEDLHLKLNHEQSLSRLADSSEAAYQMAETNIFWFRQYRLASVQVFVRRREANPPLILGTRALIGYILLVDFNHGRVVIRDPAAARVSP